MSGLYINGMEMHINGMEMPKPGQIVLVEIDENGDVFAAYDGGRTKLADYKAVPVPLHGRMIDVDSKTFPTLHRNPSNDYMKGWNACLRSVQQQPTIIEAEENET